VNGQDVLTGVGIGVGASLVMDLWNLLLKLVFGISIAQQLFARALAPAHAGRDLLCAARACSYYWNAPEQTCDVRRTTGGEGHDAT